MSSEISNLHPQHRFRDRRSEFAVFLCVKVNPVGKAALDVLAGIKRGRSAFRGPNLYNSPKYANIETASNNELRAKELPMGTIDLPKPTAGPSRRKTVPVTPRTVPPRKDERQIADGVLEEETDRIVRHLESALAAAHPGEKPMGRVAKKGLREKLHAYMERNYLELLGTLPTNGWTGTAGGGTRHTPAEVGTLLDSLGGTDRFNTGEIEKSAPANPWEHLKTHANDLLARKTDAAAFVGRESVCHVLGCVFSDNERRPKTVMDLNLSLNILEDDLVPPAFRSRSAAAYLIGKVIRDHLTQTVTREAGGPAERIVERCTETAVPAPDAQDIARNLAGDPALANLRRRGFDGALGLLVSALADRGLDYQLIENLAEEGGYDVSIREYEDTDLAALPDERYAVRIRYLDRAALDGERRAYEEAAGKFHSALKHFHDLLEVIYRDSKSIFRINDFDDLALKNRKRVKGMSKDETAGYGLSPSRMDETAGPFKKDDMRTLMAQVRERMATVCGYLNPAELRISEERLALLEREYARLESMTSPYRIRPGFLVDFEISSVKRKKTTLNAVSETLNEFLKGMPGIFEDAACELRYT